MARDIDALVAEKVMGAQTVANTEAAEGIPVGQPFLVPWYVHPSGKPTAYQWRKLRDDMPAGITPWCPSTDIAAAWQVVEKMISLGYRVAFGHDQPTDPWEVGMHKADEPQDSPNGSWESHTSMPMCFCTAALSALNIGGRTG